jgi:hypothetical protein
LHPRSTRSHYSIYQIKKSVHCAMFPEKKLRCDQMLLQVRPVRYTHPFSNNLLFCRPYSNFTELCEYSQPWELNPEKEKLTCDQMMLLVRSARDTNPSSNNPLFWPPCSKVTNLSAVASKTPFIRQRHKGLQTTTPVRCIFYISLLFIWD